MYEAGHSKLVLWDNLEGWGGEGGGWDFQDGGIPVHLWLIHVDVWQKPPQYSNYPPIEMNKWIFLKSWAPKNWCSWNVVLEKTLKSPLDCKIKPVNPKGSQPWIFIGRTDAEAKTPILWPPDAKSRLFGKDPYAGKDWRQEEKGITEDEMVGWHH